MSNEERIDKLEKRISLLERRNLNQDLTVTLQLFRLEKILRNIDRNEELESLYKEVYDECDRESDVFMSAFFEAASITKKE